MPLLAPVTKICFMGAKINRIFLLSFREIHTRNNDMTTGKKLLFALPVLIQVFLIVMVEVIIFRNLPRPDLNLLFRGNLPPEEVQLLILCFGGAVIGDLVTRVIYILHAMSEKGVPQANRTIWIIVLALLGVIAQIIYFFKYILRNRPVSKAAAEKEKARTFWEN